MSARGRLLVVDDQADIRDMAAFVLEGAGYAVATAAGGDEALAMARRVAYDLMLLDINMPGMDGWETLRLVRADDALAGMAVVMFSVKSEVRDKVHGMQEGAVDYIAKPFGVDELVRRVDRVLRSRAGGDLAGTARG